MPVHDEQAVLERSIRRLHAHLAAELPSRWRIVIADNASTDATARIAARLAAELPHVDVRRLEQRGRGHALKDAWRRSDADVRCYMDVDLSTDLRAVGPLLEPLLRGDADLAIGTRLVRRARVVRSARRELTSRLYNRLLRVTLGARFTDAQCGFKALTADAARLLLPDVRDGGWFFDTELLVLAERRGLAVHEVPVQWTEDRDSRVRVLPTALEDLRGIARLLAGAPPAHVIGGR